MKRSGQVGHIKDQRYVTSDAKNEEGKNERLLDEGCSCFKIKAGQSNKRCGVKR